VFARHALMEGASRTRRQQHAQNVLIVKRI
jgi:hypothetical protein